MPSQTAQFESLLEAMPDALVVVDQDGRIRLVNRKAELLFGYDRGDLVGRPLETLVPEARREVHRNRREGYFSDPATRDMGAGLEMTGLRRDGTEFASDISLSHTDTEDGPLVIAAVRDMTDRNTADEVNHRMGQLAAIVESSDDAIIGATLDGIITAWNPAAELLYGYSREEVLGRSILLTNHKDRAGEMNAILAKLRQGRRIRHFETTRVTKDGTVVPISLTVSPIRDPDGVMVGTSSISRDLTHQKQAFEAARSMIESSLDSLVSISPEGKIIDVNEATVKVTGLTREKLIGTDFSDYFTDPDQANAIYQRVFADGMAVDYPLTMRHLNGSLTEVLYNASVYRDSTGHVLGVFAAARDVTKQKRAQAEIAAQQRNEQERLAELERFHRLTVGRELKMIELKKEIEYLRAQGGEPGAPGGEQGRSAMTGDPTVVQREDVVDGPDR